jgi:hypothetical protein
VCADPADRTGGPPGMRRRAGTRLLALICVLGGAGSLSAHIWQGQPAGVEQKAGKPATGAPESATLAIDWARVVRVSTTTPTLQVVVNPLLRRASPIHQKAFRALQDLGCDYVRYVPWLPYPRLAVAALEPPAEGRTSWDFSLIDPMTLDFLDATAGHSNVMNFSTIPAWMFKTEKPVSYPADPDKAVWDYTQGTELRDPSGKELAEYFARVVSWYTQGGFTDEFGRRHDSGHKRKFDFWEVLNEPDLEHQPTPEKYTVWYDAIVSAIRRVSPGTKFVGISLARPGGAPEFFEYFLNPQNHQAGIPLDAISYHFYAVPALDHTPEIQQFTFFEQADKFLDVVRYIETIRKRYSPGTITMINEIGSISADDLLQSRPGHVSRPIPASYWNLSAAMYAYLFSELSRIGIEVAGESQLVGYPTQFPSVTMVNWTDGRPNARYWVLKLLHDNFGPGDKLVETQVTLAGAQSYVHARGFVTRDGRRKILLVNKRDRPFEVSLPDAAARVEVVDQTTAFDPPASRRATGRKLTLSGLGVALVTLEY